MESYYYLAWRPTEEIGRYATALIAELKSRFGHVGISRKAVGPHITLIPPFSTRHLETIKEIVRTSVAGRKPLQIHVNGFDCFNKKNKVIFLAIEASPELLQLRNELAKKINEQIPDLRQPFLPEASLTWHLTVAYQEINENFSEIWEYLQQKEKPVLEETLETLSIVGDGKIIDFPFNP
ncbi:MAG: 2'-5' RNA ligase family protein [Nanoarchaeota archaeon]|nr:2'-5' RNA ligase family protein [Nanoarchaeota archaeon]